MTVATYPVYDSSFDASRWRVGMHNPANDPGGARVVTAAAKEQYSLATKPNPGLDNFWVSLWVKQTTIDAGFQYYLSTGGNANNYSGFTVGMHGGTVAWQFNDATKVTRVLYEPSAITLVVNVWYHILFTCDRTSGQLIAYVNGIQDGTFRDISSYTGLCTPESTFSSTLWCSNTDYYVLKGIAQDMFYGVGVLPTAAERAELYSEGYGRRYGELSPALAARIVYAWPCDETSGTLASVATANNATLSYGNVAANSGFETAGTGTPATDVFGTWTETAASGSSIARTTTAGEFEAGAAACSMTIGAGAEVVSISQANLVAGREYVMTMRAKADSGTPTMSLANPTDEIKEWTLSTSWASYTHTFTAANATYTIKSKAAGGKILYIDTVTMTATADSGTTNGPSSVPTLATHVGIAGTDAKWRTESMRLALNPGTYTLKHIKAALAQTLAADCDAAYFGILQGTTSAATWMTFSTGLNYVDMTNSLVPRAAAYTFHHAFDDLEITLVAGVTYWYALSLRSASGHTTDQPQIGIMVNGQGPSGGFWRNAAQDGLLADGLAYQAAGGGEEQCRMTLEFVTPVRHLYTYDGTYTTGDTVIIPSRVDGDYWIKAFVAVADGNSLTAVLNNENDGSASAVTTLVVDMAATNQMTFGGASIALAATEPGDDFELGVNLRPTTSKIDLFYQNLTTGQGDLGAVDRVTISHACKNGSARDSSYSMSDTPRWILCRLSKLVGNR
jgi:hypothetical protein